MTYPLLGKIPTMLTPRSSFPNAVFWIGPPFVVLEFLYSFL